MSYLSWLIIGSFALVGLSVLLMVINLFLKNENKALLAAHYFTGILAGLVYLLATVLILLDGRPWNQFKSELVILLLIFVLTFLGAYLGKHKGQRFIHLLFVLILVIMVGVMHLRWSGIL